MGKCIDTVTYTLLYNRYKLIALNMFEWVNLPPTIESRHIEMALYNKGMAVIFNDEDHGLLCLPCELTGNLNPYGEGTIIRATGNGYSKVLNKKDCVIIRNNDLGLPTENYVIEYARKMTEVDLSISANVQQQKFPFFIECDKNTKRSLEIIFDKKENGTPVIYGNKAMDIDKIKVLGLNAPYVVDKLNQYKYELEREILTFFSLNNSFEKKERLNVAEVESNNSYIDMSGKIMYKCRKNIINEVNEKFNQNIGIKKVVETFENIDINNDDGGEDIE